MMMACLTTSRMPVASGEQSMGLGRCVDGRSMLMRNSGLNALTRSRETQEQRPPSLDGKLLDIRLRQIGACVGEDNSTNTRSD